MADTPQFALDAFLGIKLVQLIAGLSGGLVRALIAPAKTVSTVVCSAIVGAITAAYGTPLAVPWMQKVFDLPSTATLEPTTAFVVGLCAMSICEAIIAKFPFASKSPVQSHDGREEKPNG